jgi:hypothetical protein
MHQDITAGLRFVYNRISSLALKCIKTSMEGNTNQDEVQEFW